MGRAAGMRPARNHGGQACGGRPRLLKGGQGLVEPPLPQVRLRLVPQLDHERLHLGQPHALAHLRTVPRAAVAAGPAREKGNEHFWVRARAFGSWVRGIASSFCCTWRSSSLRLRRAVMPRSSLGTTVDERLSLARS